MGMPEIIKILNHTVQQRPNRIWTTSQVYTEVQKTADITYPQVSSSLNLLAMMNTWAGEHNICGIVKVKHGQWQWRWLGADLDWV